MSVAARHLATSLWRNALAAAAAVSLVVLGVARALAHPGRPFEWSEATLQLARALPWIAPFLAVAATFATLERERALLALLASGRSLRRVGAWMFLAGLPFAAMALALEAPWRTKGGALGDERVQLLSDGSLLVRGSSHDGRAARMSERDEGALEWGRIEARGGARRLRVEERWSAHAERATCGAAHPATVPRETVRTGRSLGREAVAGCAAAYVARDGERVVALECSTERELGRSDGGFARAARLRDALRPLVLLALGIGAWLRPFGRSFAGRLCVGLALALAYLALELWLGIAAAAGELAPGLGAFGAAATFGAAGCASWLRADRPG